MTFGTGCRGHSPDPSLRGGRGDAPSPRGVIRPFRTVLLRTQMFNRRDGGRVTENPDPNGSVKGSGETKGKREEVVTHDNLSLVLEV